MHTCCNGHQLSFLHQLQYVYVAHLSLRSLHNMSEWVSFRESCLGWTGCKLPQHTQHCCHCDSRSPSMEISLGGELQISVRLSCSAIRVHPFQLRGRSPPLSVTIIRSSLRKHRVCCLLPQRGRPAAYAST